ncbi:MAG: hypothetical protein AUH85_12375 [Chloroflexi bacterium 13_1_40CM_4_68_4]|nr:MAG: hypothetical protein AUH85_12375 [Chloroflexi bacterium 13_1_40CM_4_68_4]
MSTAARSVAAVILAAGEGRRFGGQKLLAQLEGRPLLQHVLDAANASTLDPLVLVVGADADAVLAHVRLGRARVALNAAFASGQARSLQVGLAQVDDSDAIVVMLGDQPRVTAPLLHALVARQRESGAPAVVSSQAGRRSPPALLHRDLFPEIAALSGDVGAREILARRGDVAIVEVTPSVAALDDIDTPGDKARLES